MDAQQLEFYNNSEIYFQTLKANNEDYFSEYLRFIHHYVKPGSKILDAACGIGLSTELLRKAGYTVIGVDGSARFIKYAQLHFPGADTREAQLETLPFPSKSFDFVATCNTLEYVTDVPRVLEELLRVVKPGGSLLIHSSNLLSLKHLLDAYRLRQGMTFEGKKNATELIRLALRNVRLILGKTIAHRARFIYRTPSETFEFPNNDATVFLNPVDLRLSLEQLGAKTIAYQSVEHLPDSSFLKKLGSRFFGDHMGIIRIVVRKGARYERH